MIIPTDDLPEAAAYKLLIGSIVPRAIAWVSTISGSSHQTWDGDSGADTPRPS